MGDPGIYPRRFGLKYGPVPIFAMEYSDCPRPEVDEEDDKSKFRLLEVKLPEISKDTDPQDLFEKLRNDHPHHLNPGIISVKQVKRLVNMLVEQAGGKPMSKEEEKIQQNEQQSAPSSSLHQNGSDHDPLKPQDLPPAHHHPVQNDPQKLHSSGDILDDEMPEDIISEEEYGSDLELEPEEQPPKQKNGPVKGPGPLPQEEERDFQEGSFSFEDEDVPLPEEAPASKGKGSMLGDLPGLGIPKPTDNSSAKQLSPREEDFGKPIDDADEFGDPMGKKDPQGDNEFGEKIGTKGKLGGHQEDEFDGPKRENQGAGEPKDGVGNLGESENEFDEGSVEFDEDELLPASEPTSENPLGPLPTLTKSKRSGLLGALPSMDGGSSVPLRERNLRSLGESDEEDDEFDFPVTKKQPGSLAGIPSASKGKKDPKDEPLPMDQPGDLGPKKQDDPPAEQSIDNSFEMNEEIAEDSQAHSFVSEDDDFFSREKADADAKNTLEDQNSAENPKQMDVPSGGPSTQETEDDEYGDETFAEDEQEASQAASRRDPGGLAPLEPLGKPGGGGGLTSLSSLPGIPGMPGKGGGGLAPLQPLGQKKLPGLGSSDDKPDPFAAADELGMSNASASFDMGAASPVVTKKVGQEQPPDPEPDQPAGNNEPEQNPGSDTGFGGGFGGSTNWMGGDDAGKQDGSDNNDDLSFEEESIGSEIEFSDMGSNQSKSGDDFF